MCGVRLVQERVGKRIPGHPPDEPAAPFGLPAPQAHAVPAQPIRARLDLLVLFAPWAATRVRVGLHVAGLAQRSHRMVRNLLAAVGRAPLAPPVGSRRAFGLEARRDLDLSAFARNAHRLVEGFDALAAGALAHNVRAVKNALKALLRLPLFQDARCPLGVLGDPARAAEHPHLLQRGASAAVHSTAEVLVDSD